MPITLANPGVSKLNAGIAKLMATTAPPDKNVYRLYDKWVRFLASSEYRNAPDALLFPIYKVFAATYVNLARRHGVADAEMDISLLSLAGIDATRTLIELGKMLDTVLARPKASLMRPIMLGFAGLAALLLIRKPAVRVVTIARGARRAVGAARGR